MNGGHYVSNNSNGGKSLYEGGSPGMQFSTSYSPTKQQSLGGATPQQCGLPPMSPKKQPPRQKQGALIKIRRVTQSISDRPSSVNSEGMSPVRRTEFPTEQFVLDQSQSMNDATRYAINGLKRHAYAERPERAFHTTTASQGHADDCV
jgi:hypothetical protein